MKPVSCLSAVMFTALVALPCAAQTTATLTTSGMLSGGYDGIGLFVAPESSLAGLQFTLSLSVNLTRMSGNRIGGENWVGNGGFGKPMLATGELTIAGRSYSWLIDSGSATAGLSSNRNAVGMSTNGKNMLDANNIWMSEFIQPDASSPRFVFGTDFAQTIVFDGYTLAPATSTGLYFETTIPYIPCNECPGASGPAVFTTYLEADNPRAVWTASPVPEPARYGMLAAGLGMVGLARRRVQAIRAVA
ncbi:PEP-CTERM sorting domain-containing protein [Massilia niastensis]|uniref:PEP-CTERM sorting domain-containing protein n=1 Tax=Massilia niastensis TaxID=544911 RepID=UPI00146D8DE3|nr:PEP-CTERM sorting domain-containing protein [Massilia niastensis]